MNWLANVCRLFRARHNRQHADFLIMPTTRWKQQFGGARIVSGVGIISEVFQEGQQLVVRAVPCFFDAEGCSARERPRSTSMACAHWLTHRRSGDPSHTADEVWKVAVEHKQTRSGQPADTASSDPSCSGLDVEGFLRFRPWSPLDACSSCRRTVSARRASSPRHRSPAFVARSSWRCLTSCR